MHWFWRAAIAVGAGILSLTALAALLRVLMGPIVFVFPLSLVFVFALAGSYGACVLTYDQLLRRCRVRYRPGRCQHCGYDLTGNVSGVCPECATPTQRGKEMYCRKCGHILRGITEPRCPECGEAI